MANAPRQPLSTLALSESKRLEDHLEREQGRLDALRRQGASWLTRMKQRHTIDRVQDDLLWVETRVMGKRAFIWRHGVLGYGLPIFLATAFGSFVIGGIRFHVGDLIFTLVFGGLLGIGVGLFGGSYLWGRAEARLSRTIATLASIANDQLPSP